MPWSAFAAGQAVGTDLRDGVRRARRTPGFSLVVIVTLALTMGAAITTFSLLNALSIRDLPVREPARLVAVSVVDARDTRMTFYSSLADALTAQLQSLSHSSNYNCCGLLEVRVGTDKARAPMGVVSPGYFGLLGLEPALGRFFSPADVDESVAVISHDAWRRHFASDPQVIGKTMAIGATTATVIGVTPAEFVGLNIDSGMAITVLPALARRISPGGPPNRPYITQFVIGRLAPRATAAQLEDEIRARWPAIRESATPDSLTADARRGVLTQRVRVESARKGFSTLRVKYAAGVGVLAALAVALVAVATINLGGLSLARLTRTRNELAVRLALGASRVRLMRSLIAEHLLLSVLAGALGTGLAWMLCRVFASQVWSGIGPMALSLTPDVTVLAASALLAMASGAIVSLIPCWVIIRRDIAILDRPALTAGRRAARAARFLLAAQTALALSLACVTALFAKSAVQLAAGTLGFVTDDVVLGRVSSGTADYSKLDFATYYPDLVARLEQLPGATSVALSTTMPSPIVNYRPVARRGEERGRNESPAAFELVSPKFFATLGIRVLSGRPFAWQDNTRSPGVTIVSEGLAKALFGSASLALGQHVRIGEEPHRSDLEIVGIVDDIRHNDFRSAPERTVYRPWLQEPSLSMAPLVLLKRPQQPNDTTLREVREVVESFGRESAPLAVTSLSDMVARGQLRERLLGEVSVGVAALALLLTFVGLTALMLQAVASRTREIGLRKALGATDGGLARGIAFDGCRLTLIGVALGLPLGLGGGSMARALLVDVTPHDPIVVMSVIVAFVVVALAASLLPALRAARVDPLVALRAQ